MVVVKSSPEDRKINIYGTSASRVEIQKHLKLRRWLIGRLSPRPRLGDVRDTKLLGFPLSMCANASQCSTTSVAEILIPSPCQGDSLGWSFPSSCLYSDWEKGTSGAFPHACRALRYGHVLCVIDHSGHYKPPCESSCLSHAAPLIWLFLRLENQPSFTMQQCIHTLDTLLEGTNSPSPFLPVWLKTSPGRFHSYALVHRLSPRSFHIESSSCFAQAKKKGSKLSEQHHFRTWLPSLASNSRSLSSSSSSSRLIESNQVISIRLADLLKIY